MEKKRENFMLHDFVTWIDLLLLLYTKIIHGYIC